MTSPVEVLRAEPRGFVPEAVDTPVSRASSARTALMALKRSDRLLGDGHPQAALAAVMRPLGRPPRDPDLLARLRIARGLALWQSGPPGPARVQILKAWKRAAFDLTRARALEGLATVATADQDFDEAHTALREAAQLYRGAGHAAGLARVLQCQAEAWRDAGDLGRALEAQDEAVLAARERGSDGWVEALTFRATLLTTAGRFADARADLVGAWSEDVSAPVRARFHVAAAMLDLTQGDLSAARAALSRAETAIAQGGDARTRGEVHLLVSDLHLAEGDAEPAEAQAALALSCFRTVCDPSGECRSRVRRAHALLAGRQTEEALREARRALKIAGSRRSDLRGLALLTLGRACLHLAPRDAEESFAQALRLPLPFSFTQAARIGLALASGAPAEDPVVLAALDALESRGDRRFLSYCLAELRERFPVVGATEPLAPGSVTPDPGLVCLGAAAEALQGAEPVAVRLAGALKALRAEVPWWRAALVAQPGVSLRADRDEAVELRTGDLASALAARGRGPVVVDLAGSDSWRRHPDRALHGLAWAMLAPVGRDRTLCLDLRAGASRPGDRELGLLVQIARLLASHLDEPASAAGAEEEQATLPGIIGRSPAMEALFRELARAAAGDGAVHVFGETGTGKERIAAAVHARSARASGPFVPVNASSLSDELFESELFGHVRGAFSGAVADRRGYVSEAEGGTLFLDEVTDLSPKAQSKLLRFVQDREYRRVGDPRLHRANVRIVSAANLRLEDCVAQGTFRQDLMYRLCHETLVLPPLRQRGDDVARLARHFLREAAPGTPLQVAPAVWSLVVRYPWPGNVRELQSEMARARARAGQGTVRPEHLSLALTRPAVGLLQPLRQALQLFERDHIRARLDANGWNRSLTAAQLGLSRQALLAKINRLGIAPSGPPTPASRETHGIRAPRALQSAGH